LDSLARRVEVESNKTYVRTRGNIQDQKFTNLTEDVAKVHG
jgi:hypothetical protein